MSWEYQKINLNELPRRSNEIDVLSTAGEDGWELVTILPNHIAYLKRECDEAVSEPIAIRSGKVAQESNEVITNGMAAGAVHEVKVKFRDPTTGDTWAGRGRMATWLKGKVDAGEDIEKYRV